MPLIRDEDKASTVIIIVSLITFLIVFAIAINDGIDSHCRARGGTMQDNICVIKKN